MDSSSDEESDNDIVGWKKQSRYTSPDHRAKLALKSDEVTRLRILCTLIEDQKKFQDYVLVLFTSLYALKMESERRLTNNMLNSMMDDDSSMDSESVDSVFSDFSSNDGMLSIDNNGGIIIDMSNINNINDFGMLGDSDESSSSSSTNSNSSSSSSSSGGLLKLCNRLLDDVSGTSDDSMMTFDDILRLDDDLFHRSVSDHISFLVELFATLLGCTAVELNNCCNEVIGLTAIYRYEWNAVVRNHNAPEKNRTIQELGSTNCYHYTGFTDDELRLLLHHMFHGFPIDSYVYKENRFKFEETLLIALHYNSNDTKYSEMHQVYGGNSAKYSLMVNWFSSFLYHKYYHRLCGRSLEYWVEDVPTFRKSIWRQVCLDADGNNDTNCEYERFRVFGWIDYMQVFTKQSGSGPINEDDDRRVDANEIQKEFYSAYGEGHGMKTQVVVLPNGMFASVYFTSLAQNDEGVVNISGVEEELVRVLRPVRLSDISFPALHADDIYPILSLVFIKRTANDVLQNRLSAKRINVEHMIGKNSTLFKVIRTKHRWKLLSLKKHASERLFSTFFITNVHSCVRGNKTATTFNLSTPNIEQYLDVTANHRYDGPEVDQDMIAFLQTERGV